jgi:hemerythrin-like domain-containing protein
MKPIGPLMWEHRLIERIFPVLKKELGKISTTSKADTDLLTTSVDFFRVYADRTHHGKEEDILFRELDKKSLSAQHRTIMNELVVEHVSARKMVSNLVEAKTKYLSGKAESLRDITKYLSDLIDFYPAHIEKEDKHFFFPILEYFSKEEQDDMLAEFWEFDRKLIHEKYQKVVWELEAEKTQSTASLRVLTVFN